MANIFRNPRFLELLNNPLFKACGTEEDEIMLAYAGMNLGLAPVLQICQAYNISLPFSLIWDVVSQEEVLADHGLIAYIMTVQTAHTGKVWHAVALINYRGTVYFSDPRKPFWEKMWGPYDTNGLVSVITACSRVDRFYIKGTDHWASLDGKAIGFEICKD